MLRVVLVMFLGLCLASCDASSNDPKYNPKLNPNPKYTFTVKGNIAPIFAKNIDLIWTLSYRNLNPKCDQSDYAAADGAKVFQLKNDEFRLKNKGGEYKHAFYIDKYLPGYCQWRLSSLSYTLRVGVERFGDLTFFALNPKSVTTKLNKKAKINIVCSTKKDMSCDMHTVSKFTDKIPQNLKQTGNYTFQINVVTNK